jgi:diguanylate cyclase (GGDEF)-like protein
MIRKTLLLVDDSRTILLQEQVILRRSYELRTAQNGREGVEMAIQHRPDLVLMDVVMPEMDGLEACRALRADERTRDIPIILVTTRGEHANRAAGFEAGCTDYLTKPINPVDLLARIGECLGAEPGPVRPADAARSRVLRQYQVFGAPADADLDQLARLAAHACGTPMAAITFVDREKIWTKSFVGGESTGAMPRAGSPCARVVERDAPLTVADASEDKAFKDHPFVRGNGVRFYAGMPLVPADAVPIGALAVMDRVPRTLDAAQTESLATIARQIAVELEVRRQAIRDASTGVFNRRYLEETLEREVRRAERLSVPLGLVLLNVTAPADVPRALTEVGALLQSKTRVDDVVGRYAESTFIAILPSASKDNARRRSEQLRGLVDELLATLGGSPAPTTAVVASYPDDGEDGDALLRALTGSDRG